MLEAGDAGRTDDMTDIYPPTVQRPALLKLVEALGCRDNALRRDECGDWAICGKTGHIYAIPGTLQRRGVVPGFQIFMGCDNPGEELTVRQWSAIKSAMKPFTDITNDGDSEGAFFLDRLPTSAEAEIIRRYVGIPKKREMSEEELTRLRSYAVENAFQSKKPSLSEEEAP